MTVGVGRCIEGGVLYNGSAHEMFKIAIFIECLNVQVHIHVLRYFIVQIIFSGPLGS